MENGIEVFALTADFLQAGLFLIGALAGICVGQLIGDAT
jgi:hypothetical protein